jgi:hypothetical protein
MCFFQLGLGFKLSNTFNVFKILFFTFFKLEKQYQRTGQRAKGRLGKE